jgi:hypothetical protein
MTHLIVKQLSCRYGEASNVSCSMKQPSPLDSPQLNVEIFGAFEASAAGAAPVGSTRLKP